MVSQDKTRFKQDLETVIQLETESVGQRLKNYRNNRPLVAYLSRLHQIKNQK